MTAARSRVHKLTRRRIQFNCVYTLIDLEYTIESILEISKRF